MRGIFTRRPGVLFIFVLYLSVFTSWLACADSVTLKDGSRLIGVVTALRGDTLSLKTGYAGDIKISVGDIVGIETDDVVTLRFVSGDYLSGRLIASYRASLQIAPVRGAPPVEVVLSEILAIWRGRERRPGLVWSGNLNIGAAVHGGNTDSKSFHIDASTVARADKDRIRAGADFNRETDAGLRTEDNFTVTVQHDRFVSGQKLFFYTSGKLENDDIAQLDLRTTLSTGLGYQFIENERTNLSIEAGPAFIMEQFANSPNDESIAGRWAVVADHYLLKRLLQLFHYQEGTVDAENSDDILIDSSTGVRIFIRDGLNMTLQLDFDWDQNPPAGVSSLDKRYLLTVGYKW